MTEPNYTIDTLLELEDGAAAITADGAGSDILDIGAFRMRGDVVCDVSAIDIGHADETYFISVQGSSSSTFASTIQELACLRLGDGTTIGSTIDVDDTTGRFVIPFVNERNGTSYRYLRLYVDVTGTGNSITFKAWLAKAKSMG